MNYKKLLVLCAVGVLCAISSSSWAAVFGEGNLLISTNDVLHEYTLGGTLVQSIPIPYPTTPWRDWLEWAGDIAATGPNGVFVYNGTFAPYLSFFNAVAGSWSHQTHPGWRTEFGARGIAATETHAFVTFVTIVHIMGHEPDEVEQGIIRFDLSTGAAERFATDIGPTDLTIGLDGLLYALYRGGPGEGIGESSINVYDLSTLSFIRTMSLQPVWGLGDHTSIAVNAQGEIFITHNIPFDGIIQKLDANGNVLLERNICQAAPIGHHGGTGCGPVDINVSEDGRIAVGDWSGGVTLTDEDFSEFSSFIVGHGQTFAAFVPSGFIPPEIILNHELNPAGCVEAAGPDGTLVALSGVNRNEQPVAYEWHVSNGVTGAGPDFTVNIGPDETVDVTLTITDSQTGMTASSSRTICVSDTTPPSLQIISPQPGDTFVGNDIGVRVHIDDLVDKGINSYELSIGTYMTLPYDPAQENVHIKLFKPEAGIVQESEITVHTQDSSGNQATESVNVELLHDRR